MTTFLLAILSPSLFFHGYQSKDTSYHILYGDQKFMINKLIDGFNYGGYYLKDSLADGTWIVYRPKDIPLRKRQKIQDFYSNPYYRDKVLVIAMYKNGFLNGPYTYYQYQNVNSGGSEKVITHKTVQYYEHGALNGSIKIWRDTILISSGFYKNGERDSIWSGYDDAYGFYYRIKYLEGFAIEIVKWGRHMVKIFEWSIFSNRLLEWYSNGNVKRETVFFQGIPQLSILYYESGKKSGEGLSRYKNKEILNSYRKYLNLPSLNWDIPDGKWQFWDKEGKLMQEKQFDLDIQE